MEKSVFDYESYKLYVEDWLKAKAKGGRGLKSAIAEALHCQPAYVSQVLKGSGNFSLEQAEVLNRFLGHGEAESEFFYLLLQRERAGSENLRRYFQGSIDKVREQRLVLKDRLGIEAGMSELDRARYYSAWYYTAIHILLTIPGFRGRAAISERLGLDPQTTAEALEFLVQIGVAKQVGDEFLPGTTRLHLGRNSPELLKHHTNWRVRSIVSLEKEKSDELHYSSVVSLSRADLTAIREMLVRAIEDAKARVKESPEEELCAFCLDLFRV